MKDRLQGSIGPIAVVVLGVLAALVWIAVFVDAHNPASDTASAVTATHRGAGTPTTSAKKQWTLVLGGSMATAEGASASDAGWVRLVDQRLHFPPVLNLARGPVGYDTSSGDLECGASFCPDVPKQLTSAPKDGVAVVLVSAGRYDAIAGTTTFGPAIAKLFQRLHARYPNAQILATNPLWDEGSPPATLSTIAADVQRAVTAAGGRYIDVGQPLTGRSDLVSTDGVHPNDQGHKAIAKAFITAYHSASASPSP